MVEQINQASDAMDATNVPVERSLNPAFKWKELTFMYYNYKQALVSHEQNCRIFAVIAERRNEAGMAACGMQPQAASPAKEAPKYLPDARLETVMKAETKSK